MSKLFLIFLASFHTKFTFSQLLEPIDLTWPFDNNTIYWPNIQPFTFSKKIAEFQENKDWYSMNEFCAGEHGGTHFDAPYHFFQSGWKVGDIPLSRLIANGITINLKNEVDLNNATLLLPKHLEQWELKHGSMPNNSVILVNFGWSRFYKDKNLYLGVDENNHLNFPGISEAAANWIAKKGNIVGVGVDTSSGDPGNTSDFIVHKILAKHQIYILENVKIPSEFPESNYILYVMPMKIQEGTGAPLRLLATPKK